MNNRNTEDTKTMRIGLVGLCLGVALSMSVGFCTQPPAVEWVRQFPGAGFSAGNWLVQTSDSGFAVAGYTRMPDSLRRAFLVKTDSQGLSQWSVAMGDGTFFNSMAQTRDGGYIACGDSGPQMYVAKFSADGEVEWTRKYGKTQALTRGWSIAQTSDGGYVVGGDDWFIWLVRLDSLGDLQWDRDLGSPSYDVNDDDPHWMAVAVRQTQDGGFIVTGKDDSLGLVLIKTDSSGDSVWSRNYWTPLPPAASGMDVELAADGGYVITGVNAVMKTDAPGVRMCVIKTDSLGAASWKTVLGTTGCDIGYSVAPIRGGGYIAAGLSQSSGTGEGDGYIVRLGSGGQVIWSTAYGMDHYYDYATCALQALDGGYAVTGYYASATPSLYLLKFYPDSGK